MLEIDSSSCIHNRKNSLDFKVKSSLRYSRSKLVPILQVPVMRYNGRVLCDITEGKLHASMYCKQRNTW